MNKLIFYGWIVAGLGLLFYSFTQVDLSLTLSQVSIWQGIQKSFQYVGYFNRPLSTTLYLIIIATMFGLYFVSLNLVQRKLIEWKSLWKIVIFLSVILFFAYNAFSYDLFNYIFDAKIITHYGQNPYEHKALDYPSDPMLSFMHWTHRAYPYGPAWLVLTVPLSFIGFGYFLLTFYLFKLLALASYIWCVILIKKIALRLGSDPAPAVAAFALNPLIIVETLVSGHNDIIMVLFALLGILMFFEKRYISSLLGIIASIAIKYATALVIPAIIAKGIFKVKNETFFYILTISMLAAVVLVSYRTNFQPWYLVMVLPFAAFIQYKYFVAIPALLLSIAALFQYVPYLYLGNWNPPVPAILNQIMVVSIIISILITAGWKLKQRLV